MNFETSFQDIWSSMEDFELPEKGTNWCSYAVRFSEWVDELCDFGDDPSIVSVNQAKVQLIDKYFGWYRHIPNRHRYRIGARGHTCIFQVFETAYERLQVVELSLTPPLLFVPPEPPPPLPPPPLQPIAGIFLGELKEAQDREDESADS